MASTVNSTPTGNNASGNAVHSSQQNSNGRTALRPSASTRVPDNRRQSPVDGGARYVNPISISIYCCHVPIPSYLPLAPALHRHTACRERAPKQRIYQVQRQSNESYHCPSGVLLVLGSSGRRKYLLLRQLGGQLHRSFKSYHACMLTRDLPCRRSNSQKAWTGANPITQRYSQQNGNMSFQKQQSTSPKPSKESNTSDNHAHDRLLFLVTSFIVRSFHPVSGIKSEADNLW